MKHINLLIILVLFTISCKEEKQNKKNLFKSFNKTIKLHKGEILNMPKDILMNPSKILAYDSLLIVKDKYDGKCLSLINLNTKTLVKRFLNRGKGHKEIVQAGALSKSAIEHEFIVLDIAKNSLLFFNIDSMLKYNKFEYYKSIPLAKEKGEVFFTASFVTNDKIVGTGINEKGRYMIADTTGQVIFKGLEYPYAEKNIDFYLKGMGYQAVLTTNIHNHKFATATLNGEILEIGQYNNNKLKIIDRIGSVMSKYHKNDTYVFQKNAKFGFCGLTSDNKFIYALYSGKSLEKNGYDVMNCEKFFVANWNGKPIALCKMQEKLTMIAIDSKGKYLYGVENGSDIKLIRYKISDYLPK